MDLASVLQSATGKRWILRSNRPIEFSRLDDARPFPREMISVTPLPPEMVLEKAITALTGMMEPMMWAGAINTELVRGGVDRALIDITGNPLTGPVLLALRILQSERQWLLCKSSDTRACDMRALAILSQFHDLHVPFFIR
ncbi:hypothetical protein HX900_34645 [Rhizobium sp. WYCCWR 11290]|uniref:Uncharacterized protein n=1 Tax=Rhizobium changzhiense TaxID=2692317 RepID=A0A7Z0ZW47_9HYPH|nr:hypothetical protein [Rhizobium changzhiense]NZD66189.1 hypothetical protein [Rhizobium changzhiense]